MVWMVDPAEGNWSFRPFEIFGSSRSNRVDLPSGELLLSLGLVRIRPPVYHVELMFWVREHWAACLVAGVPIRPVLIACWAFRVPLHVVLQGIAILCRVFPFGVEGASGFHYLSEVVRARRPRWSATLSSRHQVIALVLLSFWFGGLRIVLPLVLVLPIVVLLCYLIEIPLNPRFRERPLVVVDELGAEISLGID